MSTNILSVRVSDDERLMLEEAAKNSRAKLSDFIRRKALEAAEEDLLERRVIEIPAEKWDEIEALIAAPAKDIPNLRNLIEKYYD